MIYITSDLHLGHANIIEYCNRPFKNVEEMNTKLINNWNNTVNKNDKVFFLGDFAFGKNEDIIKWGNMLNGEKSIILGNHDKNNSHDLYTKAGFKYVSEYPIVFEGKWILSHDPLFTQENNPYINLYGHVHNDPTYQTIQPFNACVCTERWNYRPVPIAEIQEKVELLRTKKINT